MCLCTNNCTCVCVCHWRVATLKIDLDLLRLSLRYGPLLGALTYLWLTELMAGPSKAVCISSLIIYTYKLFARASGVVSSINRS
jgi:hypothetical protein